MQSVDASVTGAYLTVGAGQSAQLSGAKLTAAAAAASAIIRETNGAGRILCSMAAPIGSSDDLMVPINYVGNVHVTVAGAGAQLNLFQA